MTDRFERPPEHSSESLLDEATQRRIATLLDERLSFIELVKPYHTNTRVFKAPFGAFGDGELTSWLVTSGDDYSQGGIHFQHAEDPARSFSMSNIPTTLPALRPSRTHWTQKFTDGTMQHFPGQSLVKNLHRNWPINDTDSPSLSALLQAIKTQGGDQPEIEPSTIMSLLDTYLFDKHPTRFTYHQRRGHIFDAYSGTESVQSIELHTTHSTSINRTSVAAFLKTAETGNDTLAVIRDELGGVTVERRPYSHPSQRNHNRSTQQLQAGKIIDTELLEVQLELALDGLYRDKF